MKRRNFLSLGLGAMAVAAVAPATLSAVNFRETKPKAWDAKTPDAGLKELYGSASATEGSVKLTAPDIAENGAVIPVSVSTDLDAKTVTILQDANPESVVAVFTVPEGGIVDYDIRIKMQKTGTVTAVVETKDGKLFKTGKEVKVTIGGCGG
jgi:sulfur-oxidizing protein SoxY